MACVTLWIEHTLQKLIYYIFSLSQCDPKIGGLLERVRLYIYFILCSKGTTMQCANRIINSAQAHKHKLLLIWGDIVKCGLLERVRL